ncbi:MAG TPA: DUF3613 domain-containing protein [Methylococcaceae bacterium]|nr:DUF3613 domain-containing protein [Methylococcaceae bacterium]
MRLQKTIITGGVLVLSFNASITFAESSSSSERSVGKETRRWLELQSSGVAASTSRQTVSGPVADAIYRRYLDSFKHPIPEFYKSKQDGEGSGDR